MYTPLSIHEILYEKNRKKNQKIQFLLGNMRIYLNKWIIIIIIRYCIKTK